MQSEFEFIVIHKREPYWKRQYVFPFYQSYLDADQPYIYAPYIPLFVMGDHEDRQLSLWEEKTRRTPYQMSFDFLRDCYTEYLDCHTDDPEITKWRDVQIDRSSYLYRSINVDVLTKEITDAIIDDINQQCFGKLINTLIVAD